MKRILFISAALLLACVIQILGQEKHVIGTVIGSNDSIPLFMVSIVVDGTTMGTTTNNLGEYVLEFPEQSESLCFSHVGMKSKYIEIQEKKDHMLDVVLEPDIINLVGVTIIYDTLTGNIHRQLEKLDWQTLINIPVTAKGLQADDRLRDLR